MRENKNKKHGFSVPEGYFERLDQKLSGQLKDDSRHGFKVPENYFENFEVKPGFQRESSKVLSFKRPVVRKLLWLSAAASVLLFFGIKYVNANRSGLDWENLEQAEISSWIESDLAEVDAYDIAEAYSDVDLTSSTLSNEELNAYLNEIELDEILYEN